MSESGSWLVWARGLPGLTPTERLVAFELARLADGRGVAIVSIGHLVGVSGRSRRAVFGALAGLERGGWVSRQARRRGKRQSSSRFQLHRGARAALRAEPTPVVEPSLSSIARSVRGAVIDPQDNDGLREAVRRAQLEGWQGAASASLAATILECGPRQFHAAIAKGRESGRLGRDEAELDTLGVAWEAVRLHGDKIAGARRSWAMWTAIVVTICKGRDQRQRGLTIATDPFMMPEVGLRPGEGNRDEAPPVALDDFEGPLADLVDALVEAGMDETLAWAGTLRIVELAVDGDKTRRITMAAKDVRLADLGVPSECSRRWMTLLAGARRGTSGGIVAMSRVELAEWAALVVGALKAAA